MVTPQGQVIDDNLMTFSFSPGYGHITLIIAINGDGDPDYREIVLNRDDAHRLMTYLETVRRLDRGLD